MSRVGKVPVAVPDSIKVSVKDSIIDLSAGNNKKTYKLSFGVSATFVEGKIKIFAADSSVPRISMLVGMDRSNLNNIINGLKVPFKTTLEINGVGYKVSINKDLVTLTLGYSHEIIYRLPTGISAAFEKPNFIVISGIDKVSVGQVAAEIISFRKPEPYKGKGVKVSGKAILRKEGKKK